jgi:hypothetical protein
MFNISKIFGKKKQVFNEIAGFMEVKNVNGKDYCYVAQKDQWFKIIETEDGFKIYSPILNLAGELEVEYVK